MNMNWQSSDGETRNSPRGLAGMQRNEMRLLVLAFDILWDTGAGWNRAYATAKHFGSSALITSSFLASQTAPPSDPGSHLSLTRQPVERIA
jgi:hypothetical protein